MAVLVQLWIRLSGYPEILAHDVTQLSISDPHVGASF